MAKSCGIHVDQRSVHLVALDGSAKKHKITAQVSGQLDPELEPLEAITDFLRATAKKHKLSRENVGLVVDSGSAAFRSLSLPFDDKNKIEEVLKFEVESDLPQWDIDEVVTDFIVIDTKPGVASDLLVTAVPKDRLALRLAACERAGLEADEAELDGTALFNAALDCGALSEEGAQILVQVGDTSTTVVIADGGRLSSMRAIRAGALPPVKLSEDGERQPDAEPADRLAQTTSRIRREIVRTLSAARTDHPVDAILVCGHELPGFDQEALFEVPLRPLRLLPSGSDEAVEAQAVVAYGAALRALGGGVLRPRLRREELRFTGTFERMELPMAVFSLLLFFLLLVTFVVTDFQLKWRDEGDPKRDFKGDMQIWLESSNAYMLPNPPEYGGRLEVPPETIAQYTKKAARGEDPERTKFEQIREIDNMLKREIYNLERDLGQTSEVVQPQSALLGTSLVLGVLESLGDSVGRFALRGVEGNYIGGRSGSEDYVTVKMDIDFYAADDVKATENYTAFVNALQSKPWCTDFDRKQTKVLEGGEGIYVDGLVVQVDVTKLEEGEA